MVGMALAKSLYAVPTWTKTVALVREHWALQRALGCEGNPPSVYAAYRFAEKLREHGSMLERCIDGVIEGLRKKLPTYGRDLAIDASDMPAYANGQRYLSKNGPERKRYSDPDASWGHRSAVSTRKGGGFYGYRVHAAVCSTTGLPVAWTVETAKANESRFSAPADRRRPPSWPDGRDRCDGQGLRREPGLRGVRAAHLPAVDPLAGDGNRQTRRPLAAELLAWHLDLRRFRPKARRLQVALPDRGMQARLYVGEGRPPAPADPP
jgi:hypothetical protein